MDICRYARPSASAFGTLRPSGFACRHFGLDCGVAYSPDGRRIAYTGSRFFERDAEIYTINVDGSHRTKVTDNNSIDYWPSYSPNGKKIAYLRGRGPNPDIYTKNVGGGGKSNEVTDGRYIESNPSWGNRPSRLTLRPRSQPNGGARKEG